VLAFAVPSPGSSQIFGPGQSDHLAGECSGYPSVYACLDALFGSGNWRRWNNRENNLYAEAMGLARWKGGESEEWAKCDSLNHFTSETVFPSTGSSRFLAPGTADRPAFLFYWADFPRSGKLSGLNGFHSKDKHKGSGGYYTHHIVIRRNWNLVSADEERQKLEAVAHELTHAMQSVMGQSRDEAEALKLMKCVTRDLTKEDQVSPKDSTIKLHRTTFTTLRCKTVAAWQCATYVLDKRPDEWENLTAKTTEEDEEEDKKKPWCGLVYWDHGPGIGGPPPRFMCVGEGVRICEKVYKDHCEIAFAPGESGALAAAACRGDPARTL